MIERFAKNGTDRAARILTDEQIAGKRAPFHVYYRRKNGKPFVDAAYTATAADAEKFITSNIRGATVIGVLETVGEL